MYRCLTFPYILILLILVPWLVRISYFSQVVTFMLPQEDKCDIPRNTHEIDEFILRPLVSPRGGGGGGGRGVTSSKKCNHVRPSNFISLSSTRSFKPLSSTDPKRDEFSDDIFVYLFTFYILLLHFIITFYYYILTFYIITFYYYILTSYILFTHILKWILITSLGRFLYAKDAY